MFFDIVNVTFVLWTFYMTIFDLHTVVVFFDFTVSFSVKLV